MTRQTIPLNLYLVQDDLTRCYWSTLASKENHNIGSEGTDANIQSHPIIGEHGDMTQSVYNSTKCTTCHLHCLQMEISLQLDNAEAHNRVEEQST